MKSELKTHTSANQHSAIIQPIWKKEKRKQQKVSAKGFSVTVATYKTIYTMKYAL